MYYKRRVVYLQWRRAEDFCVLFNIFCLCSDFRAVCLGYTLYNDCAHAVYVVVLLWDNIRDRKIYIKKGVAK